MATIVLTHGAFHNGSCFAPLVDELAALGIDALLPELPLTDLDADEAAVRAVLDACEGPITLLGHSYGGAVVTVAGTHPAVERIVYLAAIVPDEGEPATGALVEVGAEFIGAMRVDETGTPFIDPALAPQLFYPDLDDDLAQRYAAVLRAGHTGGAVTVREAAWRSRPSTYIVCADDPIILASSQRAIAERTGATVVEIAGDHSPMVARPAELAAILAAAIS
jgi:pimeloyl-ACP methyl ester carboxylesterase